MARQRLIDRALTALRLRLRRFAAADQEELGQRVAVAVLRALTTGVEPVRNLDAMLEWRGRAVISNFVRELVRHRRLMDLETALEAAGHDPGPLAGANLTEVRRALVECIAKVPNARHRRVVHLRLVEEQDVASIAAGERAEIALVRVWLARAVALVRACVERTLGGGGRS